MALITDCWGNEWTAAVPEAVAGLDRTVLAYLGMRVETGDHLKSVFEADPDMVMAHVLKGYFGKFFAAAKMEAMARKAWEQARTLADQGSVTAQERLHVEALGWWMQGDMRGAIACWENIQLNHPRDVMAIKLVQYCQFYLGDGAAMRDSLARVMFAWDETLPGYGFLLGSYAFGLEEAGNYDKAERAGRRAVEIDPADVWGAHAVAHVLEMQGRPREGEAYLSALEPHWDKIHNFKHHAQWHRALFMLDLGQYSAALEQYDAKVWTEIAGDYLDISNGVALLWRLMEEGVDVGDRWRVLADMAAARTDEHKLVFADLHFLSALIHAGDLETAQAMRDSMAAYATKQETEAQVTRHVGLAIADAFLAASAKDMGKAVDHLLPVRQHVRIIGGSHAQRDFFDRFLVRAAIGAGRHALARHILSERLENRPDARWNWSRLAEVLSAQGKTEEADAARARQDLLLAA